MLERIRGIHYEVADVRDVAYEALGGPGFLYVNLPGYRGGYRKMYAGLDEVLTWVKPDINEFDPDEAQGLLDQFTGASCTTLAYVHHGLDQMPDGWHVLLANPIGDDRVDYVVSNQPLHDRHAALKISDKPARRFEVYDDQEITPQTKVQFIKMDQHTALYYRDLFVHRLGSTEAERYYLMLLDGRVVTALGLNDSFLLRGRSDHIWETFGISKTSNRYARLGKLFMLLLTSGDMKRYLLSTTRGYGLRNLKGIQTTSITQHEEGKTDRSVMKLVSREPLDNGCFRIVYRADFRDDTWKNCLELWLRKWGAIRRKEKSMAERLLELGQGLEIWKVHVDELLEQDVNAQVMPKSMFDRLAKTIKQDARLESLPYCAKTDRGIEIVSGHHRVRGARAGGLTEIFVIMDVSGLDENAIKAKQLVPCHTCNFG